MIEKMTFQTAACAFTPNSLEQSSTGQQQIGVASPFSLVREANPLAEAVHDRMPVMLMSEDYDGWLGPGTSVAELKSLLKPYDANLMEAYAVSRAVNSVKNDTEECIEPDTG